MINKYKKSLKKEKLNLDPYKIVINDHKYEKKLKDIHNDCFNEVGPTIDPNLTSVILISKISHRPMCYLLVEKIDENECFIWSVCTGLEYRSRGCVTKLFKKVFNLFNLKKFSLYVRKNNETALHLYKKLGFVIDPNYIDHDIYKMSKN